MFLWFYTIETYCYQYHLTQYQGFSGDFRTIFTILFGVSGPFDDARTIPGWLNIIGKNNCFHIIFEWCKIQCRRCFTLTWKHYLITRMYSYNVVLPCPESTPNKQMYSFNIVLPWPESTPNIHIIQLTLFYLGAERQPNTHIIMKLTLFYHYLIPLLIQINNALQLQLARFWYKIIIFCQRFLMIYFYKFFDVNNGFF